MYYSALLHDIGKLDVANEIINKEGKLGRFERYEINKHTDYPRWILDQISGFEDITKWASNHHEKLNGKGYPYHITGDELDVFERIMCICDIYQALTEDRPYRGKLPNDKVWEILYSMRYNNEIDGDLLEHIKNIQLNSSN